MPSSRSKRRARIITALGTWMMTKNISYSAFSAQQEFYLENWHLIDEEEFDEELEIDDEYEENKYWGYSLNR